MGSLIIQAFALFSDFTKRVLSPLSQEEKIKSLTWRYRKDDAVRENLWHAMAGVLSEFRPNRDPRDDDEFDAFAAYLLGSKWLENSGVVLLGSPDS